MQLHRRRTENVTNELEEEKCPTCHTLNHFTSTRHHRQVPRCLWAVTSSEIQNANKNTLSWQHEVTHTDTAQIHHKARTDWSGTFIFRTRATHFGNWIPESYVCSTFDRTHGPALPGKTPRSALCRCSLHWCSACNPR